MKSWQYTIPEGSSLYIMRSCIKNEGERSATIVHASTNNKKGNENNKNHGKKKQTEKTTNILKKKTDMGK